MVRYSFLLMSLFLLQKCGHTYYVNENSSVIGLTRANGVENYHKIVDSLKKINIPNDFVKAYVKLDSSYFRDGDVVYLGEEPKELVLMTYYYILAIYNPKINDSCFSNTSILNGQSKCLDSLEKIRIEKRINKLFGLKLNEE